MTQSVCPNDRAVLENESDEAKEVFLEMVRQTISHDTSGLCEELKFQLAAEWSFDARDIGDVHFSGRDGPVCSRRDCQGFGDAPREM